MNLLLAALLLEAVAVVAAVAPLAPPPPDAPPVLDAPPALTVLLGALKQPLPAETAFVEQRGSALLAEPLLLRGRLARPDADTLVREVQQPWVERTTISGSEVLIEREGREPRRFPLRRAAELEALQASFHALLSGDRALLERHYRVVLGRSGEGWQLTLTPHSQRLQRRVESVRLWGRDGQLRCMEVAERDGDRSRMLLADAAVADGDDPPAFDAECGGAP